MGGQEVRVGEYLNVRFPLLSFIIVIFDTGLSRVLNQILSKINNNDSLNLNNFKIETNQKLQINFQVPKNTEQI